MGSLWVVLVWDFVCSVNVLGLRIKFNSTQFKSLKLNSSPHICCECFLDRFTFYQNIYVCVHAFVILNLYVGMCWWVCVIAGWCVFLKLCLFLQICVYLIISKLVYVYTIPRSVGVCGGVCQ